ncbi:MAG: ADP-ribosylglycohydrolase family protein [Chloroflexi bacterium]|nr:ADP-ribosylglycohydrolase family protein [Chloroflexota bacterium]
MAVASERFSGCLIGQCLGDALGFPVEGMEPETCQRYVQDYVRPKRIPPGRAGFTFGQYTDDSQLARELIRSYVARHGFYPADYARRIADLFREGRIVGQGRATAEAARRLILGIHWDEAGTPAPSAGNGSAMRAGPIGLFFYDDRQKLVQAAVQQSIITHQDPRCQAGSVVIAGAVALAVQAQYVEAGAFLSTLAEWAELVEPGMAEHLRRLRDEWLALPPEQAAKPISRAGRAEDFGWQGISPFVVGSVLWSLYAFLRTPHDYWATICTAIEVGGDVDTTAAMAGAISGALVGLGGIPHTLARHVHDQGSWRYEALVNLALECHAVKHHHGTRL